MGGRARCNLLQTPRMDTFVVARAHHNSFMEETTRTLWLAAAVVAVCAAALSSLSRRSQRGFRWWTVALWLNAAGLGLLVATPASALTSLLAQLLMLPWPVLTLVGLRRFHSRTPMPGNERTDAMVVAAALAGAAVALAAMPGGLTSPAPLLGAAAATLLYASATLWCAPATDGARTLRAIATLWLAMALLMVLIMPLPPALGYALPVPAAALQGSGVCIGSLVLAFLGLNMSSQRIENELRSSRRRLRVLANIDMLTQVPNRRRFEELARRALESEEPGSAALVLVDIDHFKQINDKLGHAAGDRALRLVSRCTLDLLRAQDVVGRHGGDEFVLLLRRSSTTDAMAVAERLMQQLQLQSHANALPRLSLSFGIVQMRGGESIEDILLRADQALYEAKRLGRSRAVSAEGDDEDPVFHSSQRLGLTSS
jgi:diguanylate cyclase